MLAQCSGQCYRTAGYADLLCLFGDLDMTMWSDIVLTVSLKDTTGSEILISAPPMKSSCKSFRQISRCSSPAPASRNTQAQDTGWDYAIVNMAMQLESVTASSMLMVQNPSVVNNPHRHVCKTAPLSAFLYPCLPFCTKSTHRDMRTCHYTKRYSKHTRYLSTSNLLACAQTLRMSAVSSCAISRLGCQQMTNLQMTNLQMTN